MEEEKKPGVRVMRKSSEELAAGANRKPAASDEINEVFHTILSNGREVVMREMMASDLLFMEKTLSNVGDMERSLKLASRLSVDSGKISFEELQKLRMKDLKKITELLAKAGGTDDEDGDEDPNS